MSSFFGRRKRTNSTPHQGPPRSTAATTAAAQAFLAQRASNAQLSSAAAATALRSLTSSPVPPGEIDTKRRQRRGSQSSNSSAPGAIGLRRQGSSGSMSERTFRDPSPGGTFRRPADAPPMPALPNKYASKARTNLPPRPMSTEPPARVSSPVSRSFTGRGVSLDRGPNVRPPKLNTVPRVAEDPRESYESDGRRSSVNFSRPMSPQNVPSTPTSPTRSNGDVQKRSNANIAANAAALSAAERENIQHAVNEAASAPVKKKKKPASQMTEGSHLASGHSTGKPVGTAVRENEDREPKVIKKADASQPAVSKHTEIVESGLSERSKGAQAKPPLTKKPSTVREEPDLEEQDEQDKPRGVENIPPKSTPVKKAIPKDTSKLNTSSKIAPRSENMTKSIESDAQATKRASPSPARQARFSERPTLDTPGSVKHQPPARSVSPAKSAMKHSPSRGTSPSGSVSAWNKPGQTPSEISDDVSMASDEGLKTRRRKSVRVSFDDDPVVVGQAAQTDTPTSPLLSSPQDRQKKNWFAFGKDKSKRQARAATEDDGDDVIQPVPTLPSFGSIRGTKKPSEPEKTRPESPDTHAFGRALAKESEVKTPSPEPASPKSPQRSSVESSPKSDEGFENLQKSNGTAVLETQNLGSKTTHSTENARLSADIPTEAAVDEQGVPDISVQPATPGQESMDRDNRDSWLGDVPGGFPKDPEVDEKRKSSPVSEPSVPLAATTPSEVGIAEPEPEEATIQSDPDLPDIGDIAANIREQTATATIPEEDEENDSGGSVYSDAAEDPSDLEGDGFGSINAIVESPVESAKKKQKQPDQLEPPSPTTRRAKKKPVIQNDGLEEPDSDEGWDKAQSYWSGLSPNRKAELERAAEESRTKKVSNEPPAVPKTSKKVASNSQNVAVPSTTAAKPVKPALKKTVEPPSVNDTVTRTAARKPSLRKSMRDNPASMSAPDLSQPPTRMRTSMRDGSSHNTESVRMATTMRDGPTRPTPTRSASARYVAANKEIVEEPVPQHRASLLKKQRPMSAAIATPQPQSLPANKSTRPVSMVGSTAAASAGAKQPAKPALRRQLSNGSDSDSSFKRARRNRSQQDDNRYSMRRSMRAGSMAERPKSMAVPPMSERNSSKLSVRSLSPAPKLRSSLRQPAVPERPRSPTLSLFSRKKKTPESPMRAPKSGPFKSRFVDSSDEEDNRSKYFSSRFEDSSDEEPDLAPVRGIPKRQDEGDSTDLEDSEDEKKAKAVGKNGKVKSVPAPISIPEQSNEGNGLASGGGLRRSGSGRETMSPVTSEKKKKRSFFGNLGRRKDKGSKVSKVDFESAARRDTKLERSKAERDATNGGEPQTPTDIQTPVETPKASPKSPKLSRKNKGRIGSDSWPLPPPIPDSPASAPARPNTSDGVSKRPKLERGPSAVSASTGKKKRFPMLRKAFGLNN